MSFRIVLYSGVPLGQKHSHLYFSFCLHSYISCSVIQPGNSGDILQLQGNETGPHIALQTIIVSKLPSFPETGWYILFFPAHPLIAPVPVFF